MWLYSNPDMVIYKNCKKLFYPPWKDSSRLNERDRPIVVLTVLHKYYVFEYQIQVSCQL